MKTLLDAARKAYPQYQWEYEPVFGVCIAIVTIGELLGCVGRYMVVFTPLEAITQQGGER